MKKFSIQIPKPCSEDWNQMTPMEKGRFCAVCEREIYDFSTYTQRELLQHIKQEGKICGRVPANFIGTTLVDIPSNTGLRFQGIIAVAINLLFLTATTSSQGQESVKTERVNKVSHVTQSPSVEKRKEAGKNEIRGQVVDEYGNAIPGASVWIRSLNLTTSTDIKGNFKLALPEKHSKKLQVEVQFIGMETGEIRVKDLREFLTIVLKESVMILGEIRVEQIKG